MTEERARKLESVGFKWYIERGEKRTDGQRQEVVLFGKLCTIDPSKGRRADRGNFARKWQESFAKLRAWKAEHGTTYVSRTKDNPEQEKLAAWTSKQRGEYRRLSAGWVSSLTKGRIRQMDALGFNWDVSREHTRELKREEAAANKSAKNRAKKAESDRKAERRLEKRAEAWDAYFDQLVLYKAEHGTTYITRRTKTGDLHQSLHMWTKRQREGYQKFRAGKKTTWKTQRKIDKLNSIDFEWASRAAGRPKRAEEVKDAEAQAKAEDALAKAAVRKAAAETYRDEWYRRLDDLKAYKTLHGTANIPRWESRTSDGPYRDLALWAQEQRFEQSKLRRGAKSSMTEEMSRSLEALGFEGLGGINIVPRQHEATFGTNTGDTQAQAMAVARWCETASSTSGAPSSAAVATGDAKKRPKRSKPKDWRDYFADLQKYKDQNGSVHLPKKMGMCDGPNKSLCLWTYRQRQEWARMQRGEVSSMTDEKVTALEGIGFAFVAANAAASKLRC